MNEADAHARSGAPRPSRSRLSALRVGELRDLATALGIGNVSTMRKGSLVDAINERYDSTDTDLREDAQQVSDPLDGGEQQQPADAATEPAEAEPEAEQAPEAEQPEAEQAEPEQPVDDAAPEQPAAEEPAAEQAPVEQAPEAPAAEAPVEPAADEVPAEQAPEESRASEPVTSAANAVSEAEGGAEAPDAIADTVGSGDPKSAGSHVNAGITGIAEDLQELQREASDTQAEPGEGDGERQPGRRGRGRGRGRGQNAQSATAQNGGAQNGTAQNGTAQNGSAQDAPKAEAAPKAEPEQAQQAEKQPQADKQNGQQQGGQQVQQEGEGRRGRYRDRKRRGQGDFDEPEVRDDDVLIPIAGILDVLDNYAFVRTSGYLSGGNDVYVSLGQVKKYHLRKGDAVVGAIRQVPDAEASTRQKYNALVKVDSINGLPVAEAETRVAFEDLTALHPTERLRLETDPQQLAARVVDLVAPIGKGTRGLVIAPAKAGKTVLLQSIATAITKNNPEVHLMVVLVDERPEEVTDLQRSVKGEVIASTFDRTAEDHTTVAELAIERAKRLVELGYDVVVLLDSLTRLVKAYDRTVTPSGRALAPGLDAAALQPAKAFFGAARDIENGGSLTVIASMTDAASSAADAAVVEEFTAAANLELHLDGRLATKRLFPAVDVSASGTRREEALLGADEVKVTWQLRRALAGLETQAALDVVLNTLRETSTNVEFLVQMQKSLPTTGK